MKLVKLLYIKYFISFSICLTSSLVIFFIFSLLGNLNEDYLFNTIINLSLLNSFQILVYVPTFIFLISVILFIIFLKSKNEIIIIKSYMNTKKLLIFFLPLVLFFAVFEINKKDIAVFFEDNKTKLIKKNNEPVTKILFINENNSKTFKVFNNLIKGSTETTEYREYTIFNNKIQEAQFSNNLVVFNSTLIAKNYTRYKRNFIEEFKIEKAIDVNFNDLINQNLIFKDISRKSNLTISIKTINLLIFFILLFYYIFLIFFDKRYVSIKENLSSPILIGIILLIYSFFIFNNSLSFFKQEFELLASMVISMVILRLVLNE